MIRRCGGSYYILYQWSRQVYTLASQFKEKSVIGRLHIGRMQKNLCSWVKSMQACERHQLTIPDHGSLLFSSWNGQRLNQSSSLPAPSSQLLAMSRLVMYVENRDAIRTLAIYSHH